MAINQNAPQRGGVGSNGHDANDIMARLGGPRVVIVLAVVVVIAIVAVTSIMSGISNTNQQTEQRAEEREQKADDEARAARKQEKERRHQEEAQEATAVNINDITDEDLHTQIATYADEDGNISQKKVDKITYGSIESFDSLPQLASFNNIGILSLDDYNSENFSLDRIGNIQELQIGTCSVSTLDATRFPKLQKLRIDSLSDHVDTVNAKNISTFTNFHVEGYEGSIGTLDLSGDRSLEHLTVRSHVDVLNLCGAGKETSFTINFIDGGIDKILYDSKTSSGMVEFLQKYSSDYGYTLEQQ